MATKKILITTIGNRDLQIVKEIDEKGVNLKNSLFYCEEDLEINKDDPHYYLINRKKFRTITKRLLENLDKHQEIINFFEIPILKKILEKEGRFEKIIIIATDQGKSNIRSNTDTLYEGELIKKIIERKYNYDKKKIEVMLIKANLGDYGLVLKEFLKEIIKRFKEYERDYEIIINTTGGVPSLQAAALLLLRDRFYRLVYLPQGKKEPKYVDDDVRNEIEFLRKKDLLKNLIANYEYNYILMGNSDFQFILNKSKRTNLLLRFLKERKIMNLCNEQLLCDRCKEFEKVVLEHSYLLPHFINNICKKGRSLKSLDLDLVLEYKKTQLMEFVEILKIDLEKKDYTSFIGKLFRLTDSISVILIVDFLSKSDFKKDLLKEMLYEERVIPERHKGNMKEISKEIKAIFGVNDVVEKNLMGKYPDKFKDNLEAKEGELFLFSINEAFFKDSDEKLYNLLYLFLLPQIKTIGVGPRKRRHNLDLRILRNKSQYGHGFKPVDEWKVEEILKRTIGKCEKTYKTYAEYYYEKIIKKLVEKITGRSFEETKSFSYVNKLILDEIEKINFIE